MARRPLTKGTKTAERGGVSLLPAGVQRVVGSFEADAAVEILRQRYARVARYYDIRVEKDETSGNAGRENSSRVFS